MVSGRGDCFHRATQVEIDGIFFRPKYSTADERKRDPLNLFYERVWAYDGDDPAGSRQKQRNLHQISNNVGQRQ